MSETEQKVAEKKAEVAAAKRTKPPTNAELLAKVAELEKKLSEDKKVLEEQALVRVSKAIGVDPEKIKATVIETREPEAIIKFNVPYQVRVNATVYFGICEAPVSTYRVIQQALGDRRARLLEEMTGKNFVLKEVMAGSYAPQVVGEVGLDGQITHYNKGA